MQMRESAQSIAREMEGEKKGNEHAKRAEKRLQRHGIRNLHDNVVADSLLPSFRGRCMVAVSIFTIILRFSEMRRVISYQDIPSSKSPSFPHHF